MNAAVAGVRPRLRGLTAAFDELLGREVSMRALALLRIPAGAAVLLHLRPFLSDGLDGRIYRDAFYEPYAAWYPELPREAYLGLLWLGAAAAVAMSLGFLTRVATATTVRDRRLQPVPVDHALPQQPGVPAHRPRAAGGRRRAAGSCRWMRGSAAAGGDRH